MSCPKTGAFINGQGIRRKVHEVGGILRNLDLDVIGIAETWLLPGERVEVDGYQVDWNSKRG